MGIYEWFTGNKPKPVELNTESKIISKKQGLAIGLPDTKTESKGVPRETFGDVFTLEPLTHKAILKINRDKFGTGWEIKTKTGEDIPEQQKKIIDDFNQKSRIKYKLNLAGISADIYGDGFIELIFDEPEETTIDQDIPGTPPVDLNVLDAAYIDRMEKKSKGDSLSYYVMQTSRVGRKIYMHPNRIIHVVENRLPGKVFGISNILTGNNILVSKILADKKYGSLIEWTSAGMFDLTYEGADTTQINELQKKLKDRQNMNIHDEHATWQVHNPQTFNPQPFNDYFYVNIAALFNMPQHILTGVQPGQLTGSEIGLSDYYKNIISIQELIYTPILERIYTLLIGDSMKDYEIIWNPIYVDESSEANIFKTNCEAGSLLFDRSVIDEQEYRTVTKEGVQKLSGEMTFQDEPVIKPREITGNPGNKPVDEKPVTQQLMTEEELLRYETEKLKGQLELQRQEERIKEAETILEQQRKNKRGKK